ILAVPDGDTKTSARGHPLYAYAFTASQFFNFCPERNTFSPADACAACSIRRAQGRLQRHTLSHCTNHRLNLLYGAMSAATIAGNSAPAPNETGVRFSNQCAASMRMACFSGAGTSAAAAYPAVKSIAM